MKTKTLLIAAVMFLGLTAAAFAQATYSVGSIPVTAVVNTGYVELSGDITFTQVSGLSNVGTITVTYPVPITVGVSATNGTIGTGIQIISPVAPYTVGANPPADNTTLGILSVSNGQSTGQGQVVIQVPAGKGGPPFGSFTLTGVRVAVANSGLTTLNATISTTNNAITAGQTNVTVVSSIQPGIAAVNQSKDANPLSVPKAGSINGTTGVVSQQPVVTVTEGFLNAWGDPDPTVKTNAGIRFTLTAAPPAGVKVTFPATVTSSSSTVANNAVWTTIKADGSADGAAVTMTSTNGVLSVIYRVVSKTDPTLQEVLTVPVTLDTSSATLPLSVLPSLTYTVSMAPTPPGTPAAFKSDGSIVTNADQIPRYAALESAAQNLLGIAGTTTTLLVPFAQTVTTLNYNTGFAVANTTEDPGKAVTGFVAPVAQSGAITFYLFPQVSASFVNPTSPIVYTTTAGSPGTGLDAAGKLVSGSTYTVLLSQILSAAGAPADFSGYVFIVTGFTNAHGLFNISNYAGFSQGALIPVIAGPRDVGDTLPAAATTIGPENLNN